MECFCYFCFYVLWLKNRGSLFFFFLTKTVCWIGINLIIIVSFCEKSWGCLKGRCLNDNQGAW